MSKVIGRTDIPYVDPMIGPTLSTTTVYRFDDGSTVTYPVWGPTEYVYQGQPVSASSNPARDLRMAIFRHRAQFFSSATSHEDKDEDPKPKTNERGNPKRD